MSSGSFRPEASCAGGGAKASSASSRIGAHIERAFRLSMFLLALALAYSAPAAAAPDWVPAEISANTSGGYARIVFRFADDVESDVRLANGILVVSFKRPVDVSVNRLDTNAPGYVSAARRDPDGTAVRIALTRKVTVNSMAAGERLFVDLLPETWKGLPPGLPQEVVEELARRAREAEKKMREQRQLIQQRQLPPTRVRIAKQPTFSRYVFELPELISVSTERGKEKFTLVFEGALKFDLADAIAMQPPTVESVETKIDDQITRVSFSFNGKVDIRTFREDLNYVVDVGALDSKDKRIDAILSSRPGATTPEPSAKSETAPATESAAAPSGPKPAGSPFLSAGATPEQAAAAAMPPATPMPVAPAQAAPVGAEPSAAPVMTPPQSSAAAAPPIAAPGTAPAIAASEPPPAAQAAREPASVPTERKSM